MSNYRRYVVPGKTRPCVVVTNDDYNERVPVI
jgi:mRNA-degrading endonuclease toxin of MazEF toxin-antitoxin module